MKPFERTLLIVLAIGAALIAAGAALRTETPKADTEIAVCDVYNVMERLMNSDRIAPAIQEKQDAIAAEIKPLEDQLRLLQQELQAANQEDPSFQAKVQRFEQLRQQYFQLQQALTVEMQRFIAEKQVEAFELARDSASGIAEEMGYTYLVNSRDANKRIEVGGNTPDNVTASVLSRVMLMLPEEDNITEDVIEELNLENVDVTDEDE